MKKIGLLCLALVLAFGGLGIGYASWTDTLYIDGTVNTGTVDIEVVDLSGSWVWKIVDTHEFIYNHGLGRTSDVYPYGDPNAPPEADSILVASATADYDLVADDTGDTLTVTFDNLYPCDWFWVDFLVHYPGTIPVRTYAEIEVGVDSEWLEALWDAGEAGVMAFEWDPANPHDMGPMVDIHDVQLHECEWIKVILFIHIPQDDIFQDLDGSFTATVYAIQWNEYEAWVAEHED